MLFDPETGTLQEGAFWWLVDLEVRRGMRYQNAFTLMVIEVGNGRRPDLRTVGQIILEELRSSDLVGRVGPRAFAVLLPHTPAPEAMAPAARLHQRLSQYAFEGGKGVELRVGGASFPFNATDREGLVAVAREMLARTAEDRPVRFPEVG